MAGPGGGAPRKSHTKSRKGCRTCKRRHIRCDESFPQCRNCTKHSVRCDYMDLPAAGDEPLKGSQPPDLLMSPELQQMLDSWRLTGEPPMMELQVNDPTYWTRFSTIDLRLIHHLTTLSLDLHRRGYSSISPWAPKMLSLITVALSSDFAMSAVLALSASHLAWQTKNPDTENLAYHHRGVALKGLHEAIGAFSERNSEAILAASMLLSWQATEWRSWASLQQGVSTVMTAMRPWVHKSELALFLEQQRSMVRARTPSTPSLTGPSGSVSLEDSNKVEHFSAALRNLRLRLSNHEELVNHLDGLLAYLHQMQEDLPLQSPEEAFERLQPLRALLFWLPPTVLRSGESDLGAISMLAHFYALALTLEPLFPEIGGAYLGNMSVVPIERMHEMLRARRNAIPQDASIQVALSLLDFPLQTVSSYKAQRQERDPTIDPYGQPPQSPYSMQRPQYSSMADVSGARLYGSPPSHSPQAFSPAGSAYLSPIPVAAMRRESTTSHPSGESSFSTESPYSQTSFNYQDSHHWKNHTVHEIGYFGGADYHSQPQLPALTRASPQTYGGAMPNRFVTPSPVWT